MIRTAAPALALGFSLAACSATQIAGAEKTLATVDLKADQVVSTGCTGLAKYQGLVQVALSVGAIADPVLASTGKVLLGYGTGACNAATGAIADGVDKVWLDDLDVQLNGLLAKS